VTTEQKIQTKIMAWLKSIHAVCNKTVGMSKAGWPDIICCFKGRFIGIEVKRPGMKPTPLQDFKMAEIELAGGIVGVATSVDDAKYLLKDII